MFLFKAHSDSTFTGGEVFCVLLLNLYIFWSYLQLVSKFTFAEVLGIK